MPKAIRAFVQIAHRKVREHSSVVGWPPRPDRPVGEEFAVTPRIAAVELLGAHVLRLEHDMSRVILVPIPVQDAPFGFQLTKEWCAGGRCQDVKGRALQPVRLDPLDSPFEDVRPIMIEAEHEASVYLNAITMKYGNAACVVLGDRCPLSRIGEVAAIQRFEPYEHTRATAERHLSYQGWIVGYIDRDCRAPDDLQRTQGTAKSAQIGRAGSKIVINEHHV